MRFYKMGNYSYDKKRFLRIQRQSRELIIPLAYSLGSVASLLLAKPYDI